MWRAPSEARNAWNAETTAALPTASDPSFNTMLSFSGIATNFTVYGSGAPTNVPCDRYRTAYATLSERNGDLSRSQAMDLLNGVRQSLTMWSVVYDLSTRKASVALGGFYQRVYDFDAGP